jgi:PAS domain S-box-containing protein
MKGILARLTLLQATCMLLVGGLLYSVIERDISIQMRENFFARGQTLVESLAQSIQPSLVDHDLTSVQSALDGVLEKPNVICAYVLSPDGQILAHTFVPEFPEELRGLRIPPGHTWSNTALPGPDATQLTFFSQPVLAGILGNVYLGVNRGPLESSLHHMEATVFAIIAIIMVGGLLGFSLQAKRIVAPVRALTQAARKLSGTNRTDFEPLAVYSDDELGALTHAFNGMAAEIRGHEEKLAQRVRERTKRLVASERRFELAQGALGIGTWEIDVKSERIKASPECFRLYGMAEGPPEWTTLAAWRDCVHPEDRERMKREYQTGCLVGPCNREWRVIWPDGSVHWISSRSNVTFEGDHKPARVVGVSFDVTEQKQNEEQLRILSKAVQQSPVSIILTDTNGDIQYANPKAVEVTGYSLNELLGQNPRILKSGETSPEQYRELWTTIAEGVWRGVLHNKKKNGEPFWEAATISPIRGESGTVTHYLAVKEDITEQRAMAQDLQERKRAERELLQAKEAAEAANRAKSTFLANMSHEIRTPLNAVLGYSQLMLRDPGLGSAAKENLHIINRSGEHLLALITDILDMSKIEAGKTTLNPLAFDLHSLLADLNSMFSLRAQAKDLQFEVLIAPGCERFIEADKGKLRQVLINLTGNAVKFTEAGSVTLRVSTCRNEGGQAKLAVAVEDTGPGIGVAEQSRLFQPFSQSESGTNLHGGTGLGLAISQQFVRLMGGEVGLSSELGVGSTFYFEIPVALVRTAHLPEEKPPCKVLGLKSAGEVRILVVDDEPYNRGWLTSLLTAIGFSPKEAPDGAAAIELWRKWNPDLILMDMRMPVMDGMEATRRIRAQAGGQEVVILALTAHAMEDKRQEAVKSGVNDFISKPCAEGELLKKIQVHLGLTYSYAEEDAQEGQGEPVAARLGSDLGLSSELSPDLIDELRGAVESGQKPYLDQLIEKVAATDRQMAHVLKQLADNYDYDALNALLKGIPCQVET